MAEKEKNEGENGGKQVNRKINGYSIILSFEIQRYLNKNIYL